VTNARGCMTVLARGPGDGLTRSVRLALYGYEQGKREQARCKARTVGQGRERLRGPQPEMMSWGSSPSPRSTRGTPTFVVRLLWGLGRAELRDATVCLSLGDLSPLVSSTR